MEVQERAAILEKVIAYYVRHGYRVVARTDVSAQLVKPKEFSFLLAMVSLLVAYLLYYLAKKDQTLYVFVTEEGKVRITNRWGREYVVDLAARRLPSTRELERKAVWSPPAENDPGYTTSTKVMVVVLGLILVAVCVYLAVEIARVILAGL